MFSIIAPSTWQHHSSHPKIIIPSLSFPFWALKAGIDRGEEHHKAVTKMDYRLNCVGENEVSWGREMFQTTHQSVV